MSTEKQQTLGLSTDPENTGPVECLGQTFESDDARREHYLGLLAEKLKDPEFRKTPGFPVGEDVDILRLSDPPYYTACPNPFLDDFVRVHGRPYDPDEDYSREPFAVDVSVGKTDQLYRAHSYHTKVPHLAIVPSILHYTNPGDIVLDGFCGSGMTGVAAQWCGTAPNDYRQKLEEEWRQAGHDAPEWGARRAILGDLGPAASFIAANYNIPFDVVEFAEAAQRILDEVEEELGWMYETLHTDGKTKGRINYTVWSDVFSCPECSGEVVFVEEALDKETKRVRDQFPCPSCGTQLTKKNLERLYESRFDSATGDTIKSTRRRSVLINYSIGRSTFEKELDGCDIELLQRIESMPLPLGVPILQFPMDDMWEAPRLAGHGISHVHHMFLARPAHSLAALWEKATAVTNRRLRNMLLFFVEQEIWGMSILNRYSPSHFSQVNRALSGVYYVASQISEVSPWYILDGKLKRLAKAFTPEPSLRNTGTVTTGDCAHFTLAADSIDYIFTDPPFGDNFPYSELNFSVEAWHRVVTAAATEAVVERSKKNSDQKGVLEYQDLMRGCFAECLRILKPGRWMTVVFSNSKNHVWRAIQEAMGTAGFVIADVRTLDKKQRSFKQVTSAAVKQDLIISAYKPTEALAERFELGTAGEESVWAFISEHLGNVPVFVRNSGEAETVVERTPQMLHDRMIAFFVQHGVAVPVSGPDFFVGLSERFPNRDGMYFLHDQVSEYDRRRAKVTKMRQLLMFVSDEASATQWIREQLRVKPQSFQDLQPLYMPQTQAWAKHEDTIDLQEILELNFLCYDGNGPVPSQIHSYLSTNFKDLRKLEKDDVALKDKAVDRWYVPDPGKEGDLEKLRLRTLLKEFDEYRNSNSRMIRQFRSEAVRAGFKHCYDEQDYQTIVDVAAKLPEKVIQEDEKLLMYYDVATMRLGS